MSVAVSIIVPVYNTEPYLKKCITSILEQTFQDFEVILVDDGSSDGCPGICDEFARQDDRVLCVHRESGGPSAARNTGMDYASGEYMTFVDSDDFIGKRYIETLYNNLVCYDADISVCGFIETRAYDYELPDENKEDITLFRQKEAMLELLYQKTINTAVWGKMYLHRNLKEIRFREGRINEDIPFNYEAFRSAEKIVVSTRIEYIYIKRTSSLMHSRFRERSMDYLLHTGELVKYSIAEKRLEERDAALSLYLWANVNILMHLNRRRKKERSFVRKNLMKYSPYFLRNPHVRKKNKAVILLACFAEDILRILYDLELSKR